MGLAPMTNSQKSWQIFTIPNLLSILRILLIAPIIFCILQEQRIYFYWGLILIAIAIATDYFDGILARKLNQITEVGKIIDPLADKIAVGSLLIVLIIYKNFPIWVAVVIIGRDILILLAGLFWATKYKYAIASNLLGKFTVFLIAIMIVAYIIEIPILEKILTANVVFFTILSGIVYLQRFISFLRSSN